MTAPPPSPSRFRLVPMAPRDPHEPSRSASTLELFFDLVFVVAVSIAAVQLHHSLTEGHVLDGLVAYGLVFFGIWWAWMNFTWFATSFDTDDWLYRVLTIVQMAGVLVLATGIEPAFADADYTLLILSYVVMRLAMVAQWLRAARSDASIRRTAQVYAGGIAAVQLLWILQLTLPEGPGRIMLVLLIGVEVAIPVIAQRRDTTPWHPHHITERYGLFTLILLGDRDLPGRHLVDRDPRPRRPARQRRRPAGRSPGSVRPADPRPRHPDRRDPRARRRCAGPAPTREFAHAIATARAHGGSSCRTAIATLTAAATLEAAMPTAVRVTAVVVALTSVFDHVLSTWFLLRPWRSTGRPSCWRP